MNTHAHFVVPDLFLPQEIASKVCAGMQLPALEKILSRANAWPLQPTTLESWLCDTFGVAGEAVAPVTLRADGVEPGAHYWLRADPVNLRLMHDQLILQPALPVSEDEAAQMCRALNEHFAADGLHFVAPHPQRWYLRLDSDPQVSTFPVSQVAGRNIRDYLPQGGEALRWHGVLNEIQMLLFAHPLNEAREQRGEWEINGLWLWGGGVAGEALQRPANRMCTDSALAAAFAATAGIRYASLPGEECITRCVEGGQGTVLAVWDGLRAALQYDDFGGWRESLQRLEQTLLSPMLQALGSGLVEKFTLDVLQEQTSARFVLTRRDSRKFWRRVRPLDTHSLV